jgi:hypothetical protein
LAIRGGGRPMPVLGPQRIGMGFGGPPLPQHNSLAGPTAAPAMVRAAGPGGVEYAPARHRQPAGFATQPSTQPRMDHMGPAPWQQKAMLAAKDSVNGSTHQAKVRQQPPKPVRSRFREEKWQKQRALSARGRTASVDQELIKQTQELSKATASLKSSQPLVKRKQSPEEARSWWRYWHGTQSRCYYWNAFTKVYTLEAPPEMLLAGECREENSANFERDWHRAEKLDGGLMSMLTSIHDPVNGADGDGRQLSTELLARTQDLSAPELVTLHTLGFGASSADDSEQLPPQPQPQGHRTLAADQSRDESPASAAPSSPVSLLCGGMLAVAAV